MPTQNDPFRLTEVIGALSLATDLANGNPPETALRTCLLAVSLGREAGLTSSLSDVYYTALLRFVGCTAFAHEEGVSHGDDIALRNLFAPVDPIKPIEVISTALAGLSRDAGIVQRARSITTLLTKTRGRYPMMAASHCEVAVRLAARLGMSQEVCRSLGYLYERWDGRGAPSGCAEEEIPIAARLTHIAHTAEIYLRRGGRQAACEVLQQRSGSQLDPTLSSLFLRCANTLLPLIEGSSVWDLVLEAEPPQLLFASPERLEDVAGAFADFVDLLSVFTLGHSPAVASLAESAGEAAGLGASEQEKLRRAGLLHDLGKVSVPSGTWEKREKLTSAEWERIRLHPYYTERILQRSPLLAHLAPLAGAHHERADGSGYHRNLSASGLSLPANILAAADVYRALVEERPHRPAKSNEEASRQLRAEAAAGRLERSAVQAVLAAAGQAPKKIKREWPAGLSEREVEVLRWVTQGQSNKQVAQRLSISPRTVQHHLANVYEKIGVSTRGAAALFAIENDLLPR